jgi:hypothetical protein
MNDLLFISAYGDEDTAQREIAFAHFKQNEGDLPTLHVLGWDGADTDLKLDHVAHTLAEKLHWPKNPDDTAAWRAQWNSAFRHGSATSSAPLTTSPKSSPPSPATPAMPPPNSSPPSPTKAR